jgi:hypothetical protein
VRLTREELTARYNLAESELAFIQANARGDAGRLMLATLLKTRQDLGCFTMPEEVHSDTVAHLAAQLGVPPPPAWSDQARRTKSLYRYQAAVRAHLSVQPYDETAERLVTDITREAAETMSDPADLINRAVETLQASAIDLPAFSTLDRLVNSVRAEIHARIYDLVTQRLTTDHKKILDGLLAKPPNSVTTEFNRLKQTPGPATPKTIRTLDRPTRMVDRPDRPGAAFGRYHPHQAPSVRLGSGGARGERASRYLPARKATHAVAKPAASDAHAVP